MTSRGERASRVSGRVYRVLLMAYPKGFREEYGPRMVQAFGDLARAELRSGGPWGLVGLWARTLVDLAANALAERSGGERPGAVNLFRGVRWGWALLTGALAGVASYLSLHPMLFVSDLLLSLLGRDDSSPRVEFGHAYITLGMPALHLLLVLFATFFVVARKRGGGAAVTHGLLIALASVAVVQGIELYFWMSYAMFYDGYDWGGAVAYLVAALVGSLLGGLAARSARRALRPGRAVGSSGSPRRRGPRIVLLLIALAPLVALLWPVVAAAMEQSEQDGRDQKEREAKYEARHAVACPDRSTVQEHTVTGDLETDLFEIGADRFVVTLERLDLEKGDRMKPFYASVEDEQGREVSSGEVPGPSPGGPLMDGLLNIKPSMGRYVADLPAGSYRLAVDPEAWDKRYVVKIEECGV